MYGKKIVLCGILGMVWLLGMGIGEGFSAASGKECYRPGSCGHSCYYFPELGLYFECREFYKKAIRDDICGIGLKSSTPCGKLYIGTTLCDTPTGSTCGGDSYTNGEC